MYITLVSILKSLQQNTVMEKRETRKSLFHSIMFQDAGFRDNISMDVCNNKLKTFFIHN